jgi:hypothetical protein
MCMHMCTAWQQVHEYPSKPGGALLFRSHDLHESVPIARGGSPLIKASFFFKETRPTPGRRKRKVAQETLLTAGEMELIDALTAAE